MVELQDTRLLERLLERWRARPTHASQGRQGRSLLGQFYQLVAEVLANLLLERGEQKLGETSTRTSAAPRALNQERRSGGRLGVEHAILSRQARVISARERLPLEVVQCEVVEYLQLSVTVAGVDHEVEDSAITILVVAEPVRRGGRRSPLRRIVGNLDPR